MEDAFPGLHKNSWGQWQAGQGASRGPGGPPYRTLPLRKGTQGVLYPVRKAQLKASIVWVYAEDMARRLTITLSDDLYQGLELLPGTRELRGHTFCR